jgi:hypothetical protein
LFTRRTGNEYVTTHFVGTSWGLTSVGETGVEVVVLRSSIMLLGMLHPRYIAGAYPFAWEFGKFIPPMSSGVVFTPLGKVDIHSTL